MIKMEKNDLINFIRKYRLHYKQSMHIFGVKRSTIFAMTNSKSEFKINSMVARTYQSIEFMGDAKAKKFIRHVLESHPDKEHRKLKK